MASFSDWRKYTPGLERVTQALKGLKSPDEGLATILVGGTNGKGSVAVNLAHRWGPNTGVFLSPHLFSLKERIVVDGLLLEDSLWKNVYRQSEPFTLSPFERLLVMALCAFRELKLKRAVLEVGMGGRLDAVNAIASPLVSVVTKIDLDHTEFLGSTREAIAWEKCHIARYDRPFFYPAWISEAPSLDQFLNTLGCRRYPWRDGTQHWYGEEIVNQVSKVLDWVNRPWISLVGRRQAIGNLMIDTAHNEEAVRSLRDAFLSHHPPPVAHLLLGVQSHKPLDPIIDVLRPYPWKSVTVVSEPPFHPLSEWQNKWPRVQGLDFKEAARVRLNPEGEPLLCFGSHVMAARALEYANITLKLGVLQ